VESQRVRTDGQPLQRGISGAQAPQPSCDVVLPVYNEAANIDEVYRQVTAVMEAAGVAHRLLFIDDGSTDATAAVLEELAMRDQRVRFISFTRNFGHQVALTAGLEHADADCVITMDGDLQHPPQLIPQLLACWREGYAVVLTVRDDDAATPWLKRMTSRGFYRVINRLSGLTLSPGSADFRLLDRSVVDALRQCGERTKFLRGLINWAGFRSVSIPYRPQQRFQGNSKYSVGRMAAFAWDGVTAFSAMPLRAAFFLGLSISMGTFVYGFYAVAARVFWNTAVMPGWASIAISVLFLGGLQLIFIGLLGEYLARVFDEVKGRPIYFIKRRVL
jgi:polyisoprenyl-phosphate glycosyltransferase